VLCCVKDKYCVDSDSKVKLSCSASAPPFCTDRTLQVKKDPASVGLRLACLAAFRDCTAESCDWPREIRNIDFTPFYREFFCFLVFFSSFIFEMRFQHKSVNSTFDFSCFFD
jgi:hypothetical protein